MSELRINIGKKVRSKRLEYGWTAEELAKRAGTSSSHVYNIEKGYNKFSLDILERIAKALNCSAEELL